VTGDGEEREIEMKESNSKTTSELEIDHLKVGVRMLPSLACVRFTLRAIGV
jgi:hypothetical protein